MNQLGILFPFYSSSFILAVSSFDYKLGMDQMLNNKVPNTAGLKAQASGRTQVVSDHAVQGSGLKLQIPGSNLLIEEPADARTCFSHLGKCEAGGRQGCL